MQIEDMLSRFTYSHVWFIASCGVLLLLETLFPALSSTISYSNKGRIMNAALNRGRRNYTAVEFFSFSFATDCCAAGSAQGTKKQTSKRGHYCCLDNIPFFKINYHSRSVELRRTHTKRKSRVSGFCCPTRLIRPILLKLGLLDCGNMSCRGYVSSNSRL